MKMKNRGTAHSAILTGTGKRKESDYMQGGSPERCKHGFSV